MLIITLLFVFFSLSPSHEPVLADESALVDEIGITTAAAEMYALFFAIYIMATYLF